MAPLIEVVATFHAEKNRWDNTILAECEIDLSLTAKELLPEPVSPHNSFSNRITFKGESETLELKWMRSYRFYGRFVQYTNKRTNKTEWQFQFQSFVKVQPQHKQGVIRYLQDAPNVGPKIAATLWDKFEDQAVKILRETPEVAAAAASSTGFTPAKAEEAATYLKSQLAMETCSIELIGLLTGRGFPKQTAQRVVRLWGNRAAEIIRRDPYKLMAFRGCGFRLCDRMVLDMGGNPAHIKRQALAAWYGVARDTEGHTWVPIEIARRSIIGMVGGVEAEPDKALALAVRAKLLAKRTDDRGRAWIAEGKKARQEADLCRMIAKAMDEQHQWPDLSECGIGESEVRSELSQGEGSSGAGGIANPKGSLTDHQFAEIQKALQSTIGILRGGPGTGKSYTTATLIRILEKKLGVGQIAVCAPTGKAAVRLATALAEYKVGVKPTTIHSMLRVQSGGSEGERDGGWSFHFCSERPLPYRFVFVDESSMLATDLMRSLLSARAKGTHFLFIGDTNQLPPIQHGAPLRDMITAGVPSGELTEPQRNSGTIVHVCAAIRQGERFREALRDAPDEKPPQNFRVIRVLEPQAQIQAMIDRIDWAKAQGLDPIWDVQVMAAVNKKSPLARKALNELLQRKLNQHGRAVDNNPFREGDKVICTENGDYKSKDPESRYADEKGNVKVANGEFGKVITVEQKLVTVQFWYPDRIVLFPRAAKIREEPAKRQSPDRNASIEGEEETEQEGTDTGCPLDLAYACTVHKMQGSECKLAITLVDSSPAAKRLCKREWFYTAISRGKWLSLAIGNRAVIDQMCRVSALPDRKTFLSEDLVAEMWGELLGVG